MPGGTKGREPVLFSGNSARWMEGGDEGSPELVSRKFAHCVREDRQKQQWKLPCERTKRVHGNVGNVGRDLEDPSSVASVIHRTCGRDSPSPFWKSAPGAHTSVVFGTTATVRARQLARNGQANSCHMARDYVTLADLGATNGTCSCTYIVCPSDCQCFTTQSVQSVGTCVGDGR